MNKFFDNSRGQIAVLYAGIILVLVGAISLGADVGVEYVNWQQTQKVADAAALAGANYLSGGITYSDPATGKAYVTSKGCKGEGSGTSSADIASQVACTYAVNNKLDPSTITISETATTVTVGAKQTGLPYFFAKTIGLNTYDVAATATANAPGPVGTVNQGLFPIGLQCPAAPAVAGAPCTSSSLVADQSLNFGSKFVSGMAPGNWQWLDPTGGHGGGLPEVEKAITSGATGSFSVDPPNNTIYTKPGNPEKNKQVKDALANRLSSCPTITDPCGTGGNPSDIPAGDPCLVIMPVVNFLGCSGSCGMTIQGFAQVYLEPTSTTTSLTGCFIQSVAGNTLTSSGAPGLGPISPPLLIN